MIEFPHRKSFLFHNKAEESTSVINRCLKYLDDRRESLRVPELTKSKLKWTVTELLINGVKHSGESVSNLNFVFGESQLIVTKEDFGKPLKLKVFEGKKELVWPVDNADLGHAFEVYRNGIDILLVQAKSNDEAHFIISEQEDISMPSLLEETSEHFGLMIIAKAADSFEYLWNRQKKSNIFSVTFKY